MKNEDIVKKIKKQWVGKKVLITGDHPHANEVGVIETFERAGFKHALKIKLDSGGGCYCFNSALLTVLK